jgi:hypothetical protein
MLNESVRSAAASNLGQVISNIDLNQDTQFQQNFFTSLEEAHWTE